MTKMIIANRLHDGAVVFMDAAFGWVTAIGDGLVIEGEAEQERLLALAKSHEEQCLVIEPTLIDVALGETGPRPTAIREAIRAFGPTI